MKTVDSLLYVLRDLARSNPELHTQLVSVLAEKEYWHLFPYICKQDHAAQELDLGLFEQFLLDKNNDFNDRHSLFWQILLQLFSKGKNLPVNVIVNIYKNMLDEVKDHVVIKKISDYSVRRIFIFANQHNLNDVHSESRLVNKWAAAFSTLGYNVIIVSCTPHNFPYPRYFNKSFVHTRVPAGGEEVITERIKYVNMSGPPTTQYFSDFIDKYQMSSNDRYILMGHSLLQFDLVPYSNKFLVPSSTDLYCSTSDYVVFEYPVSWNNVYGKEMEWIKGPDDYTSSDSFTFKPPVVDLHNQVNVVVVGNRLEDELDELFWEAFSNIVNKIPHTVLHVVGIYKEKLVPEQLRSKVVLAGYQNDLSKYYSLMHFYLNPVRSGGGLSAKLAVKCGLPIITISQGDVYAAIKKCYHVDSLQDAADFVVAYANNEENFKDNVDGINKELSDIFGGSYGYLLSVARIIVSDF